MKRLTYISLFLGISAFLAFQVNAGKAAVPARPVPIVYHDDYNISFLGMEKLHPFDTKKYAKIMQHLAATCDIRPQDVHRPIQVTDEQLAHVHTKRYLASLRHSSEVAAIAEVSPLRYVPNFLLQRTMLNGMRYATGGTVLAAQLARTNGWAINLGGGYHHAKADNGEGFCFFADIPLAIKKLRETNHNLKVLVVDLDAHQGNGIESIVANDPKTFVFDMYSDHNYPRDYAARQHIAFNHPLPHFIKDAAYLSILHRELPRAIEATKPDLIIYNAGSDIFAGDPLGRMQVSKQGIVARDEFLFSEALSRKIPILMTLSGGYSKESAGIVSASIENLVKKFNLVTPRPESSVQARKPKLFKKIR